MKKSLLNALVYILLATPILSFAGVDTVSTHSAIMNKEIKAVVITPKNYDTSKEYPVTYLLHGYSGNYASWIKGAPQIEQLADLYQMIIVSPDGNFDSWYWDSPTNPDSKYETYFIKELIPFIDENYETIPSKEGRAITGLSMGGHGALYLAIRHQDIFGVAGSQSGGVDITPFPENWNMKGYLGTKSEFPERWKEFSVMGQLHLLSKNNLPLIIHCGTDDFFYQVNLKLHEELTYLNIPHSFTSNPGGHTWDYWRDSVQYQLLFFNNYFKGIAQKQ
ncbi:S-formylglutathione hydrolase FrmB [Algoriphagus iocasae]|uniref:S-formylglutathione hydrolase FrmB n=1 Tax=Algoriphagus iocasae TaxID=1836499 RepID=A0A841MVZ7_9BACT|nr:alpha/beta hydrolase-fold protein [Algoriphagus iocasae]MBB6326171.1 S-formylglutathione hydrolase FrmB [Algoriphagus iocasae]